MLPVFGSNQTSRRVDLSCSEVVSQQPDIQPSFAIVPGTGLPAIVGGKPVFGAPSIGTVLEVEPVTACANAIEVNKVEPKTAAMVRRDGFMNVFRLRLKLQKISASSPE